MPSLHPFRAIRYNPQHPTFTTYQDVICPPYDVISKAGQQALYAQHPHNAVRLTLNQSQPQDTASDNVYTRAAQLFASWQADGVLQQDDAPALYAYTQRWQDAVTGKTHTRYGFIGLVLLEPCGENKNGCGVLPHETTLAGPKFDRLYLAQAAQAALSQVFLVYQDAQRTVEQVLAQHHPDQTSASLQQATDADGVCHEVFALTHPQAIATVQGVLAKTSAMIADGHHRYETAWNLCQQTREQLAENNQPVPPMGELPTDYLPVFWSNIDDPGLLVYPTHRVITQWPDGWDAARFQAGFEELFVASNPNDAADMAGFYVEWPRQPDEIAAKQYYRPRSQALLSHLPQVAWGLDVSIVETLVFHGLFGMSAQELKNAHCVRFVRDEAEVARLLASKTAQVVLRMETPPLAPIISAVATGYRLPMKATYFYPKIADGWVFYPFSPSSAPPPKTFPLDSVLVLD